VVVVATTWAVLAVLLLLMWLMWLGVVVLLSQLAEELLGIVALQHGRC